MESGLTEILPVLFKYKFRQLKQINLDLNKML